jgi:hypothetical protein
LITALADNIFLGVDFLLNKAHNCGMAKVKRKPMKFWALRLDENDIAFLKRKGRKAAAWVRMAIFEARTK